MLMICILLNKNEKKKLTYLHNNIDQPFLAIQHRHVCALRYGRLIYSDHLSYMSRIKRSCIHIYRSLNFLTS